MARHFAAALIRRLNQETSKVEFLIIHYQPIKIWNGGRRLKGRFQIKFPGGKQDFNETPKETVRRECIAEAGLIIRGAREIVVILTAEGPQHYFLVDFDRCKGKLRLLMHQDRKADLFPPLWVEEDNLGPLLHGNHKRAFLEYQKKENKKGSP